jgi:hypothetical protein
VLVRTVIISLLASFCAPAFAETAKAEQSSLLECPDFVSVSEVSAKAPRSQNEVPQSLIIFRNNEEAVPQGHVEKVITASSTDLVLLDAGYKQNIRPGMVCLVEQEGKAIASLSIAESTLDHAVGLILTLAPGAVIKAGDTAKIKTVHFN